MRIDRLVLGPMQANCYALSSLKTKRALLIDPGDDYPAIREFLRNNKLEAKFIAHTHGHIDHIQADKELALPVYIHKLDAALLKDPLKNLSGFTGEPFKIEDNINILEDAQKITLDDMELEVIHTPGHTPGGISFKADKSDYPPSEGKVIFTGDTLFAGGIGRTDFPGASYDKIVSSIRKRLFVFPDNTVIYPGHGEPSTIGKEKKSNPFLS